MSARTLGQADVFKPVTVQARETRLSLQAGAFLIRKNGIEFRSPKAIPVWTEMTVELETPAEPRPVHCTGIVVACNGNRHIGFTLSMLFTGLSKQDQTRLSQMAFAQQP